MIDSKQIGLRLKWVREQLGMSGAEFGEKIGIPQSKIADLERGKTKISLEVMSQLEKTYGLSRDWLIEGFGDWKRTAAIEKFESNLDALQIASKKAHSLGLDEKDAQRLQEIIFGIKTGDRNMIITALNNLNSGEELLLNNYRSASTLGKDALISISEALHEASPRNSKRKK
ncbi:MAG: helix-turn-helix transcriptional regulator [Desulfobulbus sp.]|nr:helix-turn-helix transcriptional regulator [Desulfobulbus sp.]